MVGTNTVNKQENWWARQDSNLEPRDYESPALTIELQAREGATRCVAAMHGSGSMRHAPSGWRCHAGRDVRGLPMHFRTYERLRGDLLRLGRATSRADTARCSCVDLPCLLQKPGV